MNSINEECGLIGVFNNKDAFEIAKFGLLTLQHRGQEGCGIAYVDQNYLDVIKGRGLVSKVINNKHITCEHAIGHVRYSTTGANSLENVQPFVIRSMKETFSVCHNGNLVNTLQLREMLEDEGSIFHSSSDTEIIAHLVRKFKGSRLERIKKAVSKLEGAFAFLLMFEDEMYVIRDKNGLRPLCLGQIGDSYVVSSESCAFSVVGAKYLRDINPGEVLRINANGLHSEFYANPSKKTMCSMEYIYFARPDSTIDGMNVHQTRFKMGELLAEEDLKADIVIGVPDSGLSAAYGYAYAKNMKLELGLIKNKYSGRTFIEPTDALRKQGVKLKLSVIFEVVKDKKIVVVDDSIVRGNTSRKIVELLKEAGAKEVHLRIASPPIKFPCFYGVDFSTYDELISNRFNVEELCNFIGATSLKFLSIDELEACASQDICMACFNKNYPTNLYLDLKEANQEEK